MKKILLFALLFCYTFNLNAQIVISEIHYNPCGDQGLDSACEFMEIYNGFTNTIDISGWEIPGISYTFPTGTNFAGDSYIVISTAAGDCNDYDLTGNSFTFTGSLLNSGETLTLNDDCDNTVTTVTYAGGTTWAGMGDGNADGGCESLQLTSLSDDSDPANWTDGPLNALPNPGSGALSVGTMVFSDCIVPVELVMFSTSVDGGKAILSWTTASELNNSHFNIEHSIDGANFRAIDQVIGNGTTQEKQEYSYTHKTPAKGVNYYRLKQVDYDGAFEYSNIRAVRIERTGKITINPSAAIAEITVQLAETSGENNLIGIYDMVGRTVMMSSFDGTINTKTLDISNLQKGYYVVRVQAGSEIFTERFMKMVD